jgi:hypothetical protein
MSVTLTGYAGYFTRQGVVIGEYNRVADVYGSNLTTGFESIWVQFASSDQASVQDLPGVVDQYRLSGQQYQTTLVRDGQLASLLQASREAVVTPYSYQQSVAVVAAQMRDTSQTVQRPTIAATVTPDAGNLGDTTLAVGLVNPYGDPLDMVMAEDVTVTCTNSSVNYGETLQAVGENTVPSNSYLWPAGSGASTSLLVTDTTANGIVTDGDFANWTGTNTPVSWSIANGSAGTQVLRVADPVRGTYAAQIVGDGSSATQLYQTVSLSINTVYAVSFQAKINTVTATGTFRIALTDSTGTVLADDAGANLEYTRNLNGEITTSYQCFTAFFSTPRQLPSGTQLRVGLSVAATAAREINVDLVSVVAANQIYNGGPYLAAFSGADPTAFGDFWTVAVSNSLGSDSFVRGSDRLYNFRDNGLYWPSASSPTIPDSLVTN